MGVLTAKGIMTTDENGAANVPAPGAEDRRDDGPPAATEPDAQADTVPFSRIAPKTPSRREQATQDAVTRALDERLRPLEERWGSERQQYETRIQEAHTQLARVTGQLEEIARRPVASPAQPSPDLDMLHREAEAALVAQDLRTYEEKKRQAYKIEATQAADERIKEFEKRQPQPQQQVDPRIQYLINNHRNVAMAGHQGIEAVQIKDRELALMRVPQGPERLTKAFELADKMLETINRPAPGPRYGQEAAGSLAAIPTGRPTNAGGSAAEPGHTLTELQKSTARQAGMSHDEYVRWLYPEKWMKR